MSGVIDIAEKQNKRSINKPRNGLVHLLIQMGEFMSVNSKMVVFMGRGIYSWPDGRVYVGEFKNGKKEWCEGTLTRPEGKVEIFPSATTGSLSITYNLVAGILS